MTAAMPDRDPEEGAPLPDARSDRDHKGPGKIIYQTLESRLGKDYQADCPELLITAFGDTPEQARDALRTLVMSYLEDCDELGNLEEVLIEAGFYHNGNAWMSDEVEPVGEPKINFFGKDS